MTTTSLCPHGRAVRMTWTDGSTTDFPLLWLRDNCPSGFDPETGERTFDLLSIPSALAPPTLAQSATTLTVTWADEDKVSRFPLAWLQANRPGRTPPDPAAVQVRAWPERVALSDVPRVDARTIHTSDGALLAWLKDLKAFGLSIVEGLDDDPEAGLAVARRIAFLRETNFGVTFDVVSKPDPNNLAYTSQALPLHTDLPNQELPPGFQFLHCIANEATGGGSVFCDGIAIAEALRAEDAAAFERLASVAIPFRFHDAGVDIRRHATVIERATTGEVTEVRFNAHLAGIFDMRSDLVDDYYAAYRKFMALLRTPSRALTLKLAGGEMVVFDNRRVLHGREAFDPSTGLRRLRGCYVDRGDLDSRIRQLDQLQSQQASSAATC